jgi:transposase InsO family protein
VEGRRLGVELICAVLQVAPSSYYAAKTARPRRGHAGIDVFGRDQVARLMRAAGIEGARRSKRVRTTRLDPAVARHPDLVERAFRADAPNQLWVTDLTYVATWAGVAYVCSSSTRSPA